MFNTPAVNGSPAGTARLRAANADFVVEEVLGFEPEGSGEHLFLWVQKEGVNTQWLAQELARFAKVGAAAVGFSGIKDRYAVTRQWFSLTLPGRADPDWSQFAVDGVMILRAVRHPRKLRRGVHRANHFVIRLTELAVDRTAIEDRLAKIQTQGIPNYFGEQRFGRGGNNIAAARRMFAGQRVKRQQRSMYLSSARSYLFNQVLAARVADGTWSSGLAGDVYLLDGTNSLFGPVDESVDGRLQQQDIHPTGPLWGRGELRTVAAASKLESSIAEAEPELCQGLEAEGLRQERRALRVRVGDLLWRWGEADLELDFSLPSGSYATSLLNELISWNNTDEA